MFAASVSGVVMVELWRLTRGVRGYARLFVFSCYEQCCCSAAVLWRWL